MAEIHNRIRQVGLERAYRVVGAIEKTAQELQEQKVNRITALKRRWRRGVLWRDGVVFSVLICGYIAVGLWAGFLTWKQYLPLKLHELVLLWRLESVVIAIVLGLFISFHFLARKRAVRSVIKFLNHSIPAGPDREAYTRAFLKNARPWCSVFNTRPVGWSPRTGKKVKEIIADSDRYVQLLNDQFARPSGERRDPNGSPQVTSNSARTGVETARFFDDEPECDRFSSIETSEGKTETSKNAETRGK